MIIIIHNFLLKITYFYINGQQQKNVYNISIKKCLVLLTKKKKKHILY